MRKLKTSTVPVVVGILGLVTKDFKTYTNEVLGYRRIAEDCSPRKRTHPEKNAVHHLNTAAALGSWTGTVERTVQ